MRRRHSGERGAIAVEAALVLPVLVLLFLGMVDLTLLFRDHTSATSLTRSGARVAAAEPRFGTDTTLNGHCSPPDDNGKCGGVAAGASSFAQDAADAIQRAGSALPGKAIDEVWVYLANPKGFPSQSVSGWKSDSTSDFASCPPDTCVAYVWNNKTPGRFVYKSGDWDPSAINSCLGDNVDGQSVGVHLRATHTWLFRIFGAPDTKVRASTVMRFEPRTPFDEQKQPTSTTPGFYKGCK